jgi:hypothetical protein
MDYLDDFLCEIQSDELIEDEQWAAEVFELFKDDQLNHDII